MVQLRVTAIPEVAIHWNSGFSRLTDRPADASLANGTKSARAFSGWHARVLASMECRGGHASRGYPADRVTPGLSMLTLRVSMAPLPVAGARLSAVEEWSRRIVSLPLLASIKASRKSIAEHCAAEASKWSVLRLGCHPETPGIEPCRKFCLEPRKNRRQQ